MRASASLDGGAIGLSVACIVHCLALPLIIAGWPAAAQLLDLSESVHILILALAIPVSAAAMARGYRHHRGLAPAWFAGFGIALLVAGVAVPEAWAAETGLTVLGSLVLALGHVRNWRALRGAAPA